MERQRNELVPRIASALRRPGRAGGARSYETPPPARRGFTVADQVNQLVGASEADPNLGFMGRTMVSCARCPGATPATGS